jgi:hypothetical protein
MYRRTGMTDGAGNFTRPVFSFQVDPHVESYRAHVVVSGAHGDRATTSSVGVA